VRRNKVIEALENEQLKDQVPEFGAGDTVVVQVKVREGNRERLQAFEGVVIGRRHRGLNSSLPCVRYPTGSGSSERFSCTVR
jgi:large subunit ribosomal protein L19